MASRQEEPATEYEYDEEEYHSEVDKGLVAFFSTVTKVWLGIVILILIVGILV